jgi:hypothetical protein
VGYRPAERSRRGAFGINVDPLVILGVVGEAVDPGLVDREPLRRADFLPDCRFELGQAMNGLHVLLRNASADVGEYLNVKSSDRGRG